MNLEILKRESDQYDRSRCFGRNNDELYVSSSPTNTVISALTDLDTDETSDDSSNSRRVLIPKNSVKVLPTSATLLIGEQCRLMQSKGAQRVLVLLFLAHTIVD